MKTKVGKKQSYHSMKEESLKKLLEDLPVEWIINVEQNESNNTVRIGFGETENIIIAQLREETKAKTNKNSLIYRIEVDELEKLEQNEFPVLLVIYSPQLTQHIWIWVQQYIIRELNIKNPRWREQRTVTLHLPMNQTLDISIPKLQEIILHGMKLLSPKHRYRFAAYRGPKMDGLAVKERVR